MASISAGTRNLKFMQRGTPLPPNPIPSGSSRTIPAAAQATPNNRTPTAIPNITPAGQAEEEQWVLPTRRRTLAKGKGKPPGDRSLQKTSARPRVVVTSESSYLAFVGSDSMASGLDDQSSDEGMDDSGVIPIGGRMTFGTLPSKQSVSNLSSPRNSRSVAHVAHNLVNSWIHRSSTIVKRCRMQKPQPPPQTVLPSFQRPLGKHHHRGEREM